MITAQRRALLLAAVQAADLVATQVSPNFGDEHLDHLGVPRTVRPWLPVMKTAAVAALGATSHQPRFRRVVGLGLVAYYSAAATFHVRAGDPPTSAAPAAACAVLAATLVFRDPAPT